MLEPMAGSLMRYKPEFASDFEFGRHAAPSLAGYWAFGQFWGVYTILVFEYQQAHGLSEGALGLQLMALSISAVVTMLLLAPRMQGLQLNSSVPLSLMTLAFGSVALGLLPGGWVLLAIVCVGAGNGFIDIYLNVAAQRVEVASRRPVLQWLHACYAFGGATGAAVAGLLRFANLDYRIGFVYVGMCLFLAAAWNARTAPHDRSPDDARVVFSVQALFRSPALWIPALALLCAFLVEGSMDTWSGLFLRRQLGASALAAAAAFVAFSGAVALGRLFAGKVLFGLGRRTTIIASGLGAAIGGFVAITSDNLGVIAVAFLVMGFSLSAATPAIFGLVESVDEDATAAISAVTTIGYTGFLWSPVLIGWISQTISLRAGMAFVVSVTLGLVVLGALTPRSAAKVRTVTETGAATGAGAAPRPP